MVEMVDATLKGEPLKPFDAQIFGAAAQSLGAESGDFNRALADAVATKRAIDSQLREMSEAQQPEARDARQLDKFYGEAGSDYGASADDWGE
jgi:hypothetical protein